VALGDAGVAERRWRVAGAVDFTFPDTAVLAPGGYLVVTAGEPEAARRAFDVPPAVAVWGPWRGKLDNAGERVDLLRPVDVGDGTVVAGVVESVEYDSALPWRLSADGEGPSLERIDLRGYGDEPNNWSALSAGGTAGRPNTVVHRLWLPFVTANW